MLAQLPTWYELTTKTEIPCLTLYFYTTLISTITALIIAKGFLNSQNAVHDISTYHSDLRSTLVISFLWFSQAMELFNALLGFGRPVIRKHNWLIGQWQVATRCSLTNVQILQIIDLDNIRLRDAHSFRYVLIMLVCKMTLRPNLNCLFLKQTE